MFAQRIANRLAIQKAAGLYRNPPQIDHRSGKYVFINGQKLLNLASNDYLGLGSSKQVRRKAAENFLKYGTSSSSSRLVSGNYQTIGTAEQAYADFFGYESALFFPSGYQANFALVSTLFEKGDTILFDKHIHASTVKGMKASGATLRGFNHNQMDHLARRLSRCPDGQTAVLTEALYSMDGDLLPVTELLRLKHRFGFFTIVDEAHSVGVLGENGGGIGQPVADIAVGTFGKAMGLFGAFILMPANIREYLINFASPLIYSTTLPEAHAATALDLLEIVASCSDKRIHLAQISQYARQLLHREGFAVSGQAHILAIEIGDEDLAATVATKLRDHGIFAFAARYPTVPMGRAILRVSLTARLDSSDIELFVDKLKTVLHECRKQSMEAA